MQAHSYRQDVLSDMSPRRQRIVIQAAGIGIQPPPRTKAGAVWDGQTARVFCNVSPEDPGRHRLPAVIAERRRRVPSIIVGVLVSAGAGATDVTVAGLFPNKAVVQIDRGSLQTLSVGQKSVEGVLLVSVDRDVATFEIQGKRITVGMSQARMPASPSSAASAVIYADTRGHFITDGQINGLTIRFLVDTGATHVALPANEARRLGIDYREGKKGMAKTANGNAPTYQVRLDTVRLGNITLYGVDAVVMDSEKLSQSLLGMSFLNRLDMKRERDVMTLTERY
jgi:aspartyl protease family protein